MLVTFVRLQLQVKCNLLLLCYFCQYGKTIPCHQKRTSARTHSQNKTTADSFFYFLCSTVFFSLPRGSNFRLLSCAVDCAGYSSAFECTLSIQISQCNNTIHKCQNQQQHLKDKQKSKAVYSTIILPTLLLVDYNNTGIHMAFWQYGS